mgnify:CR=1 FL=1
MGQKVHPNGMRLGIVKEHSSIWYAGKREYAGRLLSDLKIRSFFQNRLKSSQISEIKIKRAADNVDVTIYAAKPGTILGKRGAELDKLKAAGVNWLCCFLSLTVFSDLKSSPRAFAMCLASSRASV